MSVDNAKLAEIQRRVESVPGTALAQELKNNADALLHQPNNPALHFGVGLLYARLGDFSSAAKVLNTALNLSGNNEIILGALAYLFAHHVGDHAIALGYLKKLYKLNKKNASTMTLMANSYLRLRDVKNALKFLQKAEKLEPDNLQAKFLSGLAHCQNQSTEKSQTYLNWLQNSRSEQAHQLADMLEQQIEATKTVNT